LILWEGIGLALVRKRGEALCRAPDPGKFKKKLFSMIMKSMAISEGGKNVHLCRSLLALKAFHPLCDTGALRRAAIGE